MNKTTVTLGMPIWIPEGQEKKAHYIRLALESLAKSTDYPFELILVNNGVNATSKKVIDDFIEKYPNINCKVIEEEKNIGWTGAWDKVCKEGKGDLIAILNDDLVFPVKERQDWLSRIVKHFDDNPNTGAIGPMSNFVSGRQEIRNKVANDEVLERVSYLIGLCYIVPRHVLEDVKEGDKYIDDRFFPGGSEELDLSIRIVNAGYKIFIAKDVFIHHFGNKSLELLPEFQKNQNDFYAKRQKLLVEKWGEERVAMLNNQRCPKLMIAIPTLGDVPTEFLTNFFSTIGEAFKIFGFSNVIIVCTSRTLINLAREEIFNKAIQYGVDYVFGIDDDGILSGRELRTLYNHNKDFVTGIVYMRNPPHNPAIFKGLNEKNEYIPCLERKKGLVEIDASGLACFLIKVSAVVDVLRSMEVDEFGEKKLFKNDGRFGEDISFTRLLKKHGVQLWADTNLEILGHLGEKNYVTYESFVDYQRYIKLLKEN